MVLGLWFESARATFFLLYYFKRSSRSHAKTGLPGHVDVRVFVCVCFLVMSPF